MMSPLDARQAAAGGTRGFVLFFSRSQAARRAISSSDVTQATDRGTEARRGLTLAEPAAAPAASG